MGFGLGTRYSADLDKFVHKTQTNLARKTFVDFYMVSVKVWNVSTFVFFVLLVFC